MVRTVVVTRVLMGVAVFACLAGVPREASALLNNVPFKVNGQTLTAAAGTSGDAAIFGNAAYFAYIRTDGNIGIVVDSNLGANGQSFTAIYGLSGGNPPSAAYGPALLPLGNTLYLFWVKGATLWMYEFNGTTWNGPWDLWNPGPENGPVGPPVAVAWEGQPIVYVPVVTGGVWPNNSIAQFNIQGTIGLGPSFPGNGAIPRTAARPSATVWKGALYLAWVDMLNGNKIGLINYTDSTGWSAETITGKTGVGSIFPLAAGALEMVNRSPTDLHIYRTYSTNGLSFGPSYQDPASTTNHQPVQFMNYGTSSNWVFYIGVDNELFTVLE